MRGAPFETPPPTLGWTGQVAREHAIEHARAARGVGVPWSCGCSSCVIARRDVVLFAIRRIECRFEVE